MGQKEAIEFLNEVMDADEEKRKEIEKQINILWYQYVDYERPSLLEFVEELFIRNLASAVIPS